MGIIWSEHELEVLKRVWSDPKIPLEDIEKIFLFRSLVAIRQKAMRLNLVRIEPSINECYLAKVLKVVDA